MDEVQVTEALLRAVLELIDKCDTLDELRESVKRIVGDDEGRKEKTGSVLLLQDEAPIQTPN